MRDAQAELELLVRSRHALVAIETTEERRADELVHRVAVALRLPLFRWTITRGLRRQGADRVWANSLNALDALDHVMRQREPALFLFKDLTSLFQEARVVRRVLDVTNALAGRGSSLLLVGPELVLPPSLRHAAVEFELPLPTAEELRSLAWRVVHDFSQGTPTRMQLTKAQLDTLIETLKGMSLRQAERALCRAVADDLALTEADLEGVLAAKRDILRRQGVLEYVPNAEGLDEVGGLVNLKAWLAKRRNAFASEARAFGLPAPRGMILLGVQGCGKSLAAKAVAADWSLPLLRLEAGRIYDKFIGESDKNLERALAAAEHMAPCILWIDEIEKAFAYSGSADSDAGLSRRIFGRLLSWLQDRERAVFVVATCNDVQSLPPELMRKGRFDEIFFIDLPSASEREEILTVHLKRRSREPANFDLAALAEASRGFSGAELEQAVVAALYSVFSEKRELDTEAILEELGASKPLSVTRAEEISRLREWARGRTVLA